MQDYKGLEVGVIGSGMIGMSLAALFTGNGFHTTVLTMGPEFTEQGKRNYSGFFNVLKEKKLLSQMQVEASAKRLKYTESYEDLKDAEVIFECAFEDMNVKFGIYKLIEQHCGKLKAFASTTSALSADDLAKGLKKYKSLMVVAHPFNPPHLVPYVELVKNGETTNEAAQIIYDVLEACGRKVVIMKKGAPGFIANRLQHALLREAINMIEQGYADARDIDKALMYSFMPRYTSVGLFEHQDAAGLDMVRNIDDYLFPSLSDAKQAQEFVVSRCDAGKLGQKTGEGTYTWTEEQKADFKVRAAEPYWKYFRWNCPADDK
jgi:3-hydroxybutyryl-CoA dehydrogenase